MTTEAALALSAGEASDVLSGWERRDANRVARLADSWVPQVSSKCTGIPVDLGPDYLPDGQPDVPSVTTQQILALHTALGGRYDALTTTARDLGIHQTLGTTCASQALWVALVPQPFSSADQALAWCDYAGYPVAECAARKVVAPGRSGTKMKLRSGG